MGLLNEVITKAKAVIEENTPSAKLLEQLTEYLKSPAVGGMPGLTKMFAQSGLAAKLQSWTGGGKPSPITPEEISRVLGSTEIAQMAARTGMPVEQARQKLTELLPQVVRQLAPA